MATTRLLNSFGHSRWSRALPWVALGLLALLAYENLSDNPFGLPLWLFSVPVLLAVVSMVVAVREERIVGVLVSGLVIIAIPLWFVVLVLLFHFVSLKGTDFSP